MSKASRFTNGIIVRDGRPTSPAGDTNETKLTQLRVISLSLTPASVGAATVASQNLTLTGSTASDNFVVCLSNPIANATGIVGIVKGATDVIAVSFVNPTAGALTPTTGTYVFLVGRYSNS
jgi:acetaldehyde dehydrogenase (acetylating)